MYVYDYLNRITYAEDGGITYSYAYDQNGNMTSKTVNQTTTSYTHNAANQLTSQLASHDGNGNLLQTSGGNAYGYNAKDQTTSFTPPGGSAQAASYAGTNQWELVTRANDTFLQDALGLARVSNSAGQPTIDFTRDAGGTPLGLRNPSRYYYLVDGLGSVVAMTDSAGTITNTFQYDPFGKDIGTTGTVKNPIRFQGQYYSSSLKLYKMGLRFYDPALGRWTQRDPVEQPLQGSGWNDYVFAGDNPVNYLDPTGTVKVRQCGLGGSWFYFNKRETAKIAAGQGLAAIAASLVPGAGTALGAALGALAVITGYYHSVGQCLKVKIGPQLGTPPVGVKGYGGYRGRDCR